MARRYLLFAALGQVGIGQVKRSSDLSISMDVGSFALSMQQASLEYGRSLSVSAGSYTLSLQAVRLLTSIRFSAGSFTLAFPSAGISAGRFISWSPQPTPKRRYLLFSALGQAGIGQVRRTSSTTTFALSLGTMFLRQGKVMSIDAGSVTLTMQGAALTYGRAIAPTSATFALSFQATALSLAMPFDRGAFVLTMQQFDITRASIKIRRFPRVGSTSARAKSIGSGVRTRAYGG